MLGRDCFKIRFHILIYYRNSPFKMWNIIIKLLKIICMCESIQAIKFLLNNIVSLGRFKEYDISCYYKLIFHFIIETISIGGIGIPQEDTFSNSSTNFIPLCLGHQSITGGTKDPEMLYRRNVAMYTSHRTASVQNINFTFLKNIMEQTIFKIVLFIFSATLFCSGL